ncbi:hypothetical protein DICVIV_06546 [Dictyocaulus viviparus]|uniref:Uncharacterized protein n=1 Tax=Dictyocaulus viviparus TaxID=29172 RepID=A0A0D8XRX5_DICVI|nr:hypothetical protein DICVIV_06546 [Dictyocaulus viviparus]
MEYAAGKSMFIILKRFRDAESISERSLICREIAYDFSTSLIAMFLFGIFITMAIIEIVVGSINIDLCPVNRLIPIWLIVSGSTSCLRYITTIAIIVWNKNNSLDNLYHSKECLFSFFWLFWFILGSVWTYSVSDVVKYEPASSMYCDRFTYLLAYGVITFYYAIFALGLFCCCCAVVLFI